MRQDQIDQIFNHQLKLANQFGQIEFDNTGLPFKDIPNSLTSYRGQFVIRFMLTCVLDELWEASEAERLQDGTLLEEMADVLHYIVEVCLRSGAWVVECKDPVTQFPVIEVVGEIFHNLKAKPWKVNPKTTDVLNVQRLIIKLFWSFLRAVNKAGFTDDQLVEQYFAKAEVNQQRITSGA